MVTYLASPIMPRLFKELGLVIISAMVSVAGAGMSVQLEILEVPFAWALMFVVYTASYYLLKRYALKRPVEVRIAELAIVVTLLTAYMGWAAPLLMYEPDYVGMLASYWPFILISAYVSLRGSTTKRGSPAA